MAQLYVGTSGWGYAEWKGKFYPPKIRAEDMLPFYAARFDAVEVNNPFYRMPEADTMARWRDAVPEGFRFAAKAPGFITHMRRLAGAESATAHFLELAQSLGEKQGPLLFQLPPNFAPDLIRLGAFLAFLTPFKRRIVFEFRHPDWLAEPVFDLLREHDVALCLSETDEQCAPYLPAKDFVYLRLRKGEYTADELRAWRERLSSMLAEGRDVFTFLKHEDSAKGPVYALELLAGAA